MCEPSCHRAGRSRARELGETNTASRAWECTYRGITSRREQLRGLFRFPPSRLQRPGLTRVTYESSDVRARATAGAERVRRVWPRRPGTNYELLFKKIDGLAVMVHHPLITQVASVARPRARRIAGLSVKSSAGCNRRTYKLQARTTVLRRRVGLRFRSGRSRSLLWPPPARV